MMKRVSIALNRLLTCLVLLLFATRGVAALPGALSYQGYLTDAGGIPLDVSVNITFRLYDAGTSGTAQWSDTQSVLVNNGLFSVELGSPGNPLPATLFDNPVWLGIAVGTDNEMTPRKPLTSVGFAFRAERAEIDQDTLSALSCAPDQVAKWDGAIWACSTAGTGSNDWASLTNVPSGFADDVDNDSLASQSCAASSVLKSDGSGGWACANDEDSTDWSLLTSVPAGFLDGVDDIGVGDITQIIAGTGLSGGGGAGVVTLNVAVPFTLTGSNTVGSLSDTDYALYGRHNSSNNWARIGTPWEGIYAEGNNGRAIRGVSIYSTAVQGDSTNVHGGYFSSEGVSINGAAVYAENLGAQGIAFWGETAGSDVTLGLRNNGTGDLIRGFGNDGGGYDFQVRNDGTVVTPVLIITGGGDLSENFNITDSVSHFNELDGLVVSIDPDQPGFLRLSDAAYDTRVAGVVSGAGNVRPGLLMGQRGTIADGEVPVALTGRVYCRADASNGRIEPGDLLTTSDIPGYAMKATDHERAHGAILGKAMTGLDAGQGLVLVLVSLQ